MPNSPDLNPVNYHIWSVMHDRVHQTPTQDVADLRQCLVNTWSDFSQSIVDNEIDEWHKKLQAYEDEKGGHFEHLL